jgi:hypothetical protein
VRKDGYGGTCVNEKLLFGKQILEIDEAAAVVELHTAAI